MKLYFNIPLIYLLFQRIPLRFLFLMVMLALTTTGKTQTIQTNFGKNRVQYHDDFNNWWMYETEHFVTFWYGKGRNIAKSVMQLAEMDHDEIQELMAHTMNDKIRIIVYLDQTDYSQTNIAYWETREAGGAGLAQFYDNKVIVFFNGDHEDLRLQIRAGIAQAYLMSMFRGISIQEIYQNLVSSDLPAWFIPGLVEFIRDGWPATAEQDLEYLFANQEKKLRNFNRFAKAYPELAGRSLWNFLSANYGHQSISDLLYMIRIHMNINKSFKYVFGENARDLYREWYNFYREHYASPGWAAAPVNENQSLLKTFKYPVTRVCLTDSADQLFYAENNYGRVRLIQRDLGRNKEKTLLTYGYKNEHQLSDFHYPLFRYDADSNKLGIIYEHKDKIYYRLQNLENKDFSQFEFPESVQRIYSFDLLEPGFLIFSGSTDGFSDLYYYDIEKRQVERITNNYFDESELTMGALNGRTGVFLLSNNDSGSFKPMEYDSFPPLSDYDLFFYDLNTKTVSPVVQNDGVRESALSLSNGAILVSTDRNYFTLPEIWEMENGSYIGSLAAGSHGKSILAQDLKNGLYVYVVKTEMGEWDLVEIRDLNSFFGPYPVGGKPSIPPPFARGEGTAKTPETTTEFQGEIEVDESLLFQTEFPDPPTGDNLDGNPYDLFYQPSQEKTDEKSGELPVFNRSNAVAARLRFSFNELVTRIDNEVLFEGLETYNDLNEGYSAPPAGFLVKTAVKDLFEDHVIEGGFKLASNFRGMEYFISYDNQKKKLDWKYALYRKTQTRFDNVLDPTGDPDKLKIRTNLGLVRAKYPFDIYRSLHLTGTIRFDNTILTASDIESLNFPNITEQRAILGAEYIFDNTSSKSVNLMSGTRYKFFARFVNRFDIQLSKVSKFDLSAGRMGIAGFDARHYLDVLSHSTLALRIAGQTSFGNEKNIYFLGGVENAFFAKTDQTYPIPAGEDFAYMIQAANLRGYDYNIRNGSSFTVLNIEFRLPVFSYLTQGHIRYSVIRDFQLTGFLDMGAAWYGLTPFSVENEANVYLHEAPPAIILKIRQFKDPLVGGVGIGARTTVFGYFLKVDYAWGFESGAFLHPKWHFSMGYDF